MDYILAVDGGGTKTLAAIATTEGRILGTARAGSCDIYGGPQAFEEVAKAVAGACDAAGIGTDAITHAVYSLCGADWPEDIRAWEDFLAGRRLGRSITVVNDAIGAMAADGTTENLLAVIIGTGCATGSRSAAGAHWHSSFWQLVQGGGEISAAVLDAVYKADLGIAPPTALTPAVLGHFGLNDVTELLHAFTARERERPAQAALLSPLLLDVADQRDAAAIDIVTRFAKAYAAMALAAARKVGIIGQPARLMFSGGVMRHPSSRLRNLITAGITAEMGPLTLVTSHGEPLQGVILMALRAAGAPCDGASRDNIARSLTDDDFFRT